MLKSTTRAKRLPPIVGSRPTFRIGTTSVPGVGESMMTRTPWGGRFTADHPVIPNFPVRNESCSVVPAAISAVLVARGRLAAGGARDGLGVKEDEQLRAGRDGAGNSQVQEAVLVRMED